MVSSGRVVVNAEEELNPDRVLQQQDLLLYTAPKENEPPIDADKVERLYEDEEVLVCCKNGQLPVTEGGRYCENTLTSLLNRRALRFMKRPRIEAGEEEGDALCQYYPVHRLDKETSGVLVFAKSLASSQFLSQAIEFHSSEMVKQTEVWFSSSAAGASSQASSTGVDTAPVLSIEAFDTIRRAAANGIRKTYIAVVVGSPPVGKVYVVCNRIGPVASDSQMCSDPQHIKFAKLKMKCFDVEDGVGGDRGASDVNGNQSAIGRSQGKQAISRLEVLATGHGISVLRVDLLTGRTHQIRLHCAHIGFPILGDKLYTTATPGVTGGGCPVPDEVYLARVKAEGEWIPDLLLPSVKCRRHLLHAAVLSFPHPPAKPAADSSVTTHFSDPSAWMCEDVLSDTSGLADDLKRMLSNCSAVAEES